MDRAESFAIRSTEDVKVWTNLKRGVDRSVKLEEGLKASRLEMSKHLITAGKNTELRDDVRLALKEYGDVINRNENAREHYLTHVKDTLQNGVDHQLTAAKKMKVDSAKNVKILKGKPGQALDQQFKGAAKEYETKKSTYYLLMLQHAISAEMSYHATALQKLADSVEQINKIDPKAASDAADLFLNTKSKPQ